jgi:hypothetical protein
MEKEISRPLISNSASSGLNFMRIINLIINETQWRKKRGSFKPSHPGLYVRAF